MSETLRQRIGRSAARAERAAISAVARALATSACVWSFLALSLLPAFWIASLDVVQFISSGVLQLVALPVLAVAAKFDNRDLARQSAEQHDAVMEILADVRQAQAELHAMHGEMRALLAERGA